MSERKVEIRVGILFVAAAAVLILGVLWFKNYQFGKKNAEVQVAFPKASGLMRGDQVEVQGVASGQVSGLRAEGGRAIVTLSLRKRVKLYPGAQFVLENVGIMGQKLVQIYPGSQGNPVPLEGQIFQGSYQEGVTELVADLSSTLDTFHRLADRLDRLTASFTEGSGGMNQSLKNLQDITSDLAGFLQSSRGDLTASVRNFRLAMEDVHETLDGREEAIADVLNDVHHTSRQMATTFSTLDTTLVQLQGLMTRLQSDDGSFGKLMQDDQLYTQMLNTLKETSTLMSDIKSNPKKYVRISLF